MSKKIKDKLWYAVSKRNFKKLRQAVSGGIFSHSSSSRRCMGHVFNKDRAENLKMWAACHLPPVHHLPETCRLPTYIISSYPHQTLPADLQTLTSGSLQVLILVEAANLLSLSLSQKISKNDLELFAQSFPDHHGEHCSKPPAHLLPEHQQLLVQLQLRHLTSQPRPVQ